MIRNPQRRTLLLAAGVLLISGCKAGSTASPTSTPTTTATATPTATPTPTPAAAGSATATPAPAASAAAGPSAAAPGPAAVPAREQIVASFSGRAPSYWGLEAPAVLQVLPEPAAGIALTIDYCGGPGGSGVDHAVLDVLQRLEIPATLFCNARWISANQGLARELAAVPYFELANHGSRHLPLSVTGNSAYGIAGTQDTAQVYEEIMVNDQILLDITGSRPRFFRPGTAFLDDVAAEIAHAVGTIPTGFSINADGGATYSAPMVAAETAAARPGDIIISHGNHPDSGTGAGFAQALPLLLDKGYTFTTLSAAIQ